MAGYVFSFTADSSNIGNTTAGSMWQEIVLSDTEGSYVNPATGHQSIEISAVDSANATTSSVLKLAWVDCDSNKANAKIGVSKIETITLTNNSIRTGIDGGSGGYVYDVSAASSSNSIVRVIGIGSVIDLRPSPVALPKRRLFIGLTTKGSGSGTITVIVTPTRIL